MVPNFILISCGTVSSLPQAEMITSPCELQRFVWHSSEDASHHSCFTGWTYAHCLMDSTEALNVRRPGTPLSALRGSGLHSWLPTSSPLSVPTLQGGLLSNQLWLGHEAALANRTLTNVMWTEASTAFTYQRCFCYYSLEPWDRYNG